MTIKGAISFSLGIIGLGCSVFLPPDETRSTVLKISLTFVVSGLIEFVSYLIENRKRWKILLSKVIRRNKPVRVTVAYLFRIEVNGRYALIKRHKKDENVGYQPIGGAFKYLREENRELFDNLGIEPCNAVPRDEDTEHDLRIIIRKRKNLIDFLKWFESRKNREIDPRREFIEELAAPGHIRLEDFLHVKFTFINKHTEGILKSPVYAVDEFRYAEIYEIRTESDAQKRALTNLSQAGDEIIFATPEEIRNGRTHQGAAILPHTFKILPK